MATQDDSGGQFGSFGGQYIPDVLNEAIKQLEVAYHEAKNDPTFWSELEHLLLHYTGRPSPLYYAKRMTEDLGGCRIYLKREDLNHTGAHKINNVLGQGLLTKRMGKPRVIAETGAGQHGVATATAAAVLGLECMIYMGAEDVRRQQLNVYRMRLLGAECIPVEKGQKTLTEAVDEALQDWLTTADSTHYLIGSTVGPHPFPTIVRDFQAVVGREAKEQIQQLEGRLPDYVLACIGGGSNAAGIFYPFIEDRSVQLIGVEAAGEGLDTQRHAATLTLGRPGVIHGMQTIVLQDEAGQALPVHSVSAGLDYPGVGPEHAHWHTSGRAQYVAATDQEALDAFAYLSRTEGIIPALETAHAVAHAIKLAPTLPRDQVMVINLSGRGDKDCVEVARLTGNDFSAVG